MQLAMAVPSLEELDSFKRRCRTVHRNPDSQQHDSEIKTSDHAELQNQEKQENQDLRTVAEVPSPPDESQGEENAVSSGKRRINGNEDSKVPSERKKPLYTDGLPVACTPTSQRRSQGWPLAAAGRSTLCGKGSAKPSALWATKMNVRFSATTKDNEHKRSLIKTPARKSPHVTIPGSTPKGQAVLRTYKLKTTDGNSASVVTPLKLTTQATQTSVSNKKPVFDLKASVSRPLNYEPHKGKLKPWGQSKENNSLKEHVNRVSFHKKTYKQPPLQTREEQRNNMSKDERRRKQ
ncbi:hypothetical protein GH733_007488, partial [Mirounga leonina]